MMHEITTEELIVIKEAIELALEEFKGVEEARTGDDYVLTTGAQEACEQALIILIPRMEEVWEAEDADASYRY